MALPASKLSVLKTLAAAGDWLGALRIAARFPELGEHKERITKGWNAHLRPEFYRELGHDPDALVADAFQALRERYGLPAGGEGPA